MISRLRVVGGPRNEAERLHSELHHLIGACPPFRIRPALERFRLSLDAFAFRSDISGVLIRDGRHHHIAVNRRHPRCRQRFAAAHELYHYLHHEWWLETDGLWVCEDNPPDWLRKMELEADAFAAHFLMPDDCLAACATGSLERVAKMFMVSEETAARRLREVVGFPRMVAG